MVQLSKFTTLLVAGASLVLRGQAQGFQVPNITAAQAQAAQVTMQQLAQNSTNQDALTADVAKAAAAAAGITQNFTNIGTQLLEIDNKNLQPEKFFPTWQGYRNDYIALLQSSKNLASAVAGYADEFNDGILYIINNPSIPTSSKVSAIDAFINKSTTFQEASSALSISFTELASNLTEFTGNFANFAHNRTVSDNSTIDDLLGEIGQLQEAVKKIEVSMIALGLGMGATLLGSAAGLVFFPEFAPAILIGAAIIEGILAVTEIGLVTAMSIDQNKIASLQNQVDDLQADLSLINGVQNQLNSTATNDVPALVAHISLFTGVWQDVASDCTKLIGWLQDGAEDADMPDILVVWLQQASTIYATMSAALTQYATQVTILGRLDELEAHHIGHHRDEL
ncbi:hypothetical protein BV25DRAFT_1825066 [Artomyces pyxidatus]|uniref:Uncharacterized protein n=1 Tax=Artomyces pyxidatus TaxID=48021 RepID=A0ACB8T4G1_9AGAM|nr:hypothetical protein BV25DRAFT_1825066 [Artomyces pyxidatus]